MSQCPKCGLQMGLHHSILPGCSCTTASPFTYTVVSPKRELVGLTDEEIEAEFGYIDELLRNICYRTQARLKEKNT